VAPSQVRKPAITFGKKPTARDRPRDRLLHSNAKQAGTVNIFSPPTVKADPVSLIVKPVTKEASKLARLPAANAEPTKKRVVAKKPESKLIAQVKTASSVIKAEKSASAPSPPEPKVPSQLIKRNDSFSGENELPDTVTVSVKLTLVLEYM
jgi:hypothetical protein